MNQVLSQNDQQLAKYLQQMSILYGENQQACFPNQVLTHGRIWTISEQQPDRMTPRLCYENAYLFSDKSNIYCEGWAVPDNIPLPIWHAWCINLEGEVLELTWEKPGISYIGIPFQDDWLVETFLNYREYGIGGEACANGFPEDTSEWVHPIQSKGQTILRS